MIARVTKQDLEQIRAEVIDLYRRTGHQFAHVFIPELEKAVAWIDPNGAPRLTDWVLVEREGKFSLEREPPPSSRMIFFGVTLEKAGGRWRAGEAFARILKTNLSDD